MEISNITFVSVDLENNLELCIEFRRDAHLVSYGSLLTFSVEETEKYFSHIASKENYIFQHVCHNENIIGQLEFQPCANKAAYVNLFFLKKEYRGIGLGEVLHKHVVTSITQAGCSLAELRVIPGNIAAEKFYRKNGWFSVGVPTDRGQLMQLNF